MAVMVDPLWRLLETYHGVVYWAPESKPEYSRLGLKGGWMGYFATRAGALGPVGPEVVTACFYNFAPRMVARALPDAWRYTTPAEAIAARLRVADAALRRLLGDRVEAPELRQAAQLAVPLVAAADPAGRPLFAAHAAQPIPPHPHLALFWAASALREFRGDGHNAALLHAGVNGCEANVLMSALGLVSPEQRTYRGWTEAEWQQAAERATTRGWLAADGSLTDQGAQARDAIEQATEAMAAPALRPLSAPDKQQLGRLLSSLVERIVDGAGVPYPNAVGVPPAPRIG